MNAFLASLSLRCLLICLVALTSVPFLAASASAAEPTFQAALQANIIWEFASDRTRMIQASMVIVALGCAMMWWYR